MQRNDVVFCDIVDICMTRFSDIRTIFTEVVIDEGFDDFAEELRQMHKNSSHTITVQLGIQLSSCDGYWYKKFDSRIFVFGECVSRVFAANSYVLIRVNGDYIDTMKPPMLFILDVARQYLTSDLTVTSALKFDPSRRHLVAMKQYIQSIASVVSGGDDVFNVPTNQAVKIIDRSIIRRAIGDEMCAVLDEAEWELTGLAWNTEVENYYRVKLLANKSGKTAIIVFEIWHSHLIEPLYEDEEDSDLMNNDGFNEFDFGDPT